MKTMALIWKTAELVPPAKLDYIFTSESNQILYSNKKKEKKRIKVHVKKNFQQIWNII